MLFCFIKTIKIVTDWLNPEAKQTTTFAPRHDVLLLPAHNEQTDHFKKELCKRVKSLNWPSIYDIQVKGLGRGIVTNSNVEKREILVDYYGEEKKGMSFEEYLETPENQREYLL